MTLFTIFLVIFRICALSIYNGNPSTFSEKRRGEYFLEGGGGGDYF